MSLISQEEPILDRPHGHQANWHRARELLETAQYEAVAEVLREAQRESEQKGQRVLPDILAAAHGICLACHQCQVETAWHQRGSQESGQREQAFRQELYDILDLVIAGRMSEPSAKPATLPAAPSSKTTLPEREESKSNLWQRALTLLGRGRSALSPETKAPVEPLKVSTTSPAEPVERSAPLTIEEPEESTPSSVEEAETPTSLSFKKVEVPPAPPVAKEEKEEDRGPPSLVGYCLGPFRVYQNDQLIAEWTSLKGQSIFKYLVMHQGGPVAKDILMDVFWPDVDPGDTRRNLHQAIYSLRQTLRQGQPDLQPILFKKDCYLLNSEMAIWLDFEEFEKHIQAGRRLEAAAQLAAAIAEYSIAEALYQGDFLEEDLYEEWPSLQRQHLRNLYLDVAGRLSDYYAQQGEFTAAIALCQKILTKDNCYEEAHRRLMQCYLTQGQRHLAVRQYQTCMQALKEELDLTPAEETVALYQRITTG